LIKTAQFLFIQARLIQQGLKLPMQELVFSLQSIRHQDNCGQEKIQ